MRATRSHRPVLLALLSALILVECSQSFAAEPPALRLQTIRVLPLQENRFGKTLPPDKFGPNGEGLWLASGGSISLARSNWGSFAFPRLADGEVVPIFGHLYRSRGGDTLERLSQDDQRQKYAARAGSYIVPLRRRKIGRCQIIYGGSGFEDLYLESIEVAETGERNEPVAAMKIHDVRNQPQMFRRGDALQLGKVTYVVRNIVPRDARTQLIGWLEIGPADER